MIPLKDHSACKYDHRVVNVPRNFFLSSSSHQFLFLSLSMFLSSFSPCLFLFPFPFSPSIFIFSFFPHLLFNLLASPPFSSLFLLFSSPLFFPSLCQRKLGTPCHFFPYRICPNEYSPNTILTLAHILTL